MKFSPTTDYIFRFWPSSGGNGWSKLDLKCKLWVHLFFMKTQIIQIFFKECLLFRRVYLWRELRQYSTKFGGVMAQKPSKKDHFMEAESTLKTLKTFNLTTTNAILIKLTTIMYLYESVNQKPLRNSVFLA